ncbi:hypothetical protein NQ176_g1979 [Zarea fungicola]|uniref:Uncharacterized protein n=1 Tax=Zarea fungicola TaxID=93591 RepID=A0ACC1NR13_9HYPO|nr:hypothetical protein NQ176_g1979 [Lecanicillium fungicola]
MLPSVIGTSLTRFVSGTADVDFVDKVAKAIPTAWQKDSDDMALVDSITLLYERRLHASKMLGPGAELVAAPWKLWAVLERAAVIEPALFHVMLLHYTLAVAPIARFCDPKHVKHLLLHLDTTHGCPMIVESGRSNSHQNTRTTATYDALSGGFLLHTPEHDAMKSPTIAGSPHVGKVALVLAELITAEERRGVFFFVVPIRDATGALLPGVQTTPATSTSALRVDYAAVSFNKVNVPLEMWMNDGAQILPHNGFHDHSGISGRSARTHSIGLLVWQSIISMAAAVSRAASSIAMEYSANHFSAKPAVCERPILEQRNQCDAIFGAYATAFAVTALANHAKCQRVEGDVGEASTSHFGAWVSVNEEMALLKASATDLARQVIARCRQHCGSNGAVGTTGRVFGAYQGIVDTYTTAGGDNELTMLDAGSRMAHAPKRSLPSVALNSCPTTLRACCELAEHAEAKLHNRLVRIISEAKALGKEPSTALDNHLPLVIDAGTAKADLIMLSVVEKEIAREVNSTARQIFEKLAAIFALVWVERRAGILFDLELLKGGSIESIRKNRAELCDNLLGHTVELIEGFSPPMEFLFRFPSMNT